MPDSARVAATRPKTPSGARRITSLTMLVTASERSASICLLLGLALRKAKPRAMAQARMPIKLPLSRALIGLSTTFSSRVFSTSLMPPGGDSSALLLTRVRLDEGKAGGHRDQRCAEGADQVQQQNRFDMGLLALLMVGNRRRYQYEYQHRSHGLQRRDKHRAEEADARGSFRQKQRQGDTGHQADSNLQHQAGAVEQL